MILTIITVATEAATELAIPLRKPSGNQFHTQVGNRYSIPCANGDLITTHKFHGN